MTDPITLALATFFSLGAIVGIVIGVAASRCYHTARLLRTLRELTDELERGDL